MRLIINCILMCNLGSPSGVTWWIVIVCGQIWTKLSVIGLPVEFGQHLRRNQKNCGMRPVISCIRQLNLCSAFGVYWRILDMHGRIGTRLVINIICLWNLGSSSGIFWWIVDVCGQIGTRLVINFVCLWNLGSDSGLTWRIVDVRGWIGTRQTCH
jgi:hypothetical protein